jgi:hypothetical protein
MKHRIVKIPSPVIFRHAERPVGDRGLFQLLFERDGPRWLAASSVEKPSAEF